MESFLVVFFLEHLSLGFCTGFNRVWIVIENVKIVGALLEVGIVNYGVKNDCDPALALLSEYIGKEDSLV